MTLLFIKNMPMKTFSDYPLENKVG
uniref:Uncharacterized protein n=1 Tax=Anguilla anguilla TaxID=7936 RepID=A0A0E9PHQ4_ANGAN